MPVLDERRHHIHTDILARCDGVPGGSSLIGGLGGAAYDPAMTADVLAATLVAPGQLELRRFPYPEHLEPGACC